MSFKKGNELKENIKSVLTPEDIYNRYGYARSKKDSHVICPICGKEKFTLYNENGYCFSCRNSLDIFNIYMMLTGEDFKLALYTIAKDFYIISDEEFEIYTSNSRHTNNKAVTINKQRLIELKLEKEKKENECPQSKLQSKEVIDRVYRTIKELSPITELQRFSIKKERGLSDFRIDAEYFNMPTVDDSFYKRLFKTIKERYGYEPKDLLGVPGFYSHDMIKIEFVQRYGIGILMSGADNIVHGIQIRNYNKIDKLTGKMILFDKDKNGKKTKKPKYYWCGSKDEPNGCSPGSPVDVLIPKNIPFNTCFITEGKFKIEKIIEEFASPAISVQGVGNWRGKINPEIKFISKNYFNIRNIFCCYDADLSMNFSIFTACRDLIKEELKDLDLASVKIAVWDYKLGKGLDDMINNGHKDKLISIDFNYFAEYFEKYMKKIKKMYPNTTETKILDSNNNEVDENIIHQIYKDKVLNPLNIYCL